MEDPADVRIHTKKCDYLWQCKYCKIEYDKESAVRKHHCRDESSDSQGEEEVTIKKEKVEITEEKDNSVPNSETTIVKEIKESMIVEKENNTIDESIKEVDTPVKEVVTEEVMWDYRIGQNLVRKKILVTFKKYSHLFIRTK